MVNVIMYPFKVAVKEISAISRREESNIIRQAEDGVMQPQAKECWQIPHAGETRN